MKERKNAFLLCFYDFFAWQSFKNRHKLGAQVQRVPENQQIWGEFRWIFLINKERKIKNE